jgi:hypothetical protein
MYYATRVLRNDGKSEVLELSILECHVEVVGRVSGTEKCAGAGGGPGHP